MPPENLADLREAFRAAYLLGARDEATMRGSGSPLITDRDALEAWQEVLADMREPPEQTEGGE